ncbi:MAG: DUF4124 domain-containing protein, partial [Gallionella sp.]
MTVESAYSVAGRSASFAKVEHRTPVYRAMILAALTLGLTFSLPVSAKLYKWVDNDGVTHYGEVVPPEYANKDKVELDKNGQVVKKDEVMTPERRRAKEQEDAKKHADEKAAQDQQLRDKTLLNTYSNVKEIDLARNRSLQQIDARLNTINSAIKSSKADLSALQSEADGYAKRNRAVPESLQEDLRNAQARLDKLNKDLMQPQAEKAAVVSRYDADKARYT